MLLACSVMSGSLGAAEITRSMHKRESCARMLSYLHDRMQYLVPNLQPLLESAARQFPELEFLQACQSKMQRGEPFLAAWQAALQSEKALGAEQIRWLLDLGATLGSADLASQLSALCYAHGLFAQDIAERREGSKKQARLLQNLGVLCGLLLVIVLI